MSRSTMRDSIYPSPSYDFLSHLDECGTTTKQCGEILNSGMEKLNRGTEDLPRLGKVLRNQHHYLVLPQPVIQSHLSALSSSLAPQIDTLISKSESLIQTQSEKLANLEERLQFINSTKLGPNPGRSKTVLPTTFQDISTDSSATEESSSSGGGLEGIDMKSLNPTQRRKVLALRAKRNKLEEEKMKLEESISG